MQGILITLQYRELHALVCPQAIESRQKLLGHWLLGAYVRRGVDHLRVSLNDCVSMRVLDSLFAAAYNVVLVLEICVILLHRLVDCLEGGHQVVEDGRPP